MRETFLITIQNRLIKYSDKIEYVNPENVYVTKKYYMRKIKALAERKILLTYYKVLVSPIL